MFSLTNEFLYKVYNFQICTNVNAAKLADLRKEMDTNCKTVTQDSKNQIANKKECDKGNFKIVTRGSHTKNVFKPLRGGGDGG